jgi:hypothetical protein
MCHNHRFVQTKMCFFWTNGKYSTFILLQTDDICIERKQWQTGCITGTETETESRIRTNSQKSNIPALI